MYGGPGECGEARLVDLYGGDFTDADFYDYAHTTPSGANKVGREIAPSIAASELIDRLRE